MTTSTEKGNSTVIDTKFPLSWLIGCSAAIVFSMGGFAFQVNSMSNALSKIEVKTDARDERLNMMNQAILVRQGKDEAQDDKIVRLNADMAEVRRDIDELKRKQTWAPK